MPEYSNKNMKDAFQETPDLYGKKIQPVKKPEINVGIDTNNVVLNNIINSGTASTLDMTSIESFTRVSQNRNQLYTLLDSMAEDSMVASVLDIFTQESTEYNDTGRIVWVESSDDSISKYITYLLDTMNIDKNIYGWTKSLCHYGDIYIRLFRESEYDDGLLDFEDDDNTKSTLTEDVKIIAYQTSDRYAHYVEMEPNPADIFELTRLGKTYAYIKAPTLNTQKQDNIEWSYYKYQFKKSDIEIHPATDYVHACLEDSASRSPEEVTIFIDDKKTYNTVTGKDDTPELKYKVRRGQSLLYPVFKIWRELTLLENSVLLNRVTKSSIVRMINVEVGDMPKENIGPHLQGIKSLIEQKSAINTGMSMNEYTNPGPIENNVYVPTHNGIGAITTQQIGGDVDVKGLADLEYYRDKFFGALGIPKQYAGFTEDGAGFNGGQSLSIISSKFAKKVKRIQNALIQAITDIVNLMLIDKGLSKYINKFSIRMLPPTTQEELDRRANMADRINSVSDIMNLLADVEDGVIKLKMLKSLLSTTGAIQDNEIISLLQEEIDKLESEIEGGADIPDDDMDIDMNMDFGGSSPRHSIGGGERPAFEMPSHNNTPEVDSGESDNLPTPNELGIDMTNNDTE